MRLAMLTAGAQHRLGLVEGDHVYEIEFGGDMADLIGAGPDSLLELVEQARRRPPLAQHEIAFGPPVRPRKNVMAVGRNYLEHVREIPGAGAAERPPPEHPIIFTKPPTSIIGPGDPIDTSNDPTGTTDYEGELAVVIGRGGKRIDAASADDHIFGYTIVNDVTARAMQRRHGQWLLGKGPDTFCPIGPWIVTADEMGDLAGTRVTTSVNGELRQDGSISDLIFDIPTLISTISSVITLEPGDVIATGTPAGVGAGFDPPRYLSPGDVVSVSVEGIGTLTNPVV